MLFRISYLSFLFRNQIGFYEVHTLAIILYTTAVIGISMFFIYWLSACKIKCHILHYSNIKFTNFQISV